MSSFRRGFLNRSPLVLLAALALLVPALLGFESFFVSGRWTAVPLEYWLRKSSDDYVYVSWTVGRNKQDLPSKPSVYLLGGSTAREAIVSGEGLAADVKQLGGPDIAAWNLGSMNQNFAQSLAVADNVPVTPTYLLIGLNLGRFTPDRGSNMKQSDGRELILKSSFLRHYVADTYGKYRYSPTILRGIFAQLTSWAQERRDQLLRGTILLRPYGQHRYNLRSSHTVAQKQRMVKVWNKVRYPKFRRNLRFNLDLLEQLLIRAQQRGLHVVLLELPFNRDLIGDRFDYAVVQYRAPVKALAREYGAPYVDFNPELPIPNRDFHDLSHLVEPGRVVWQRRLAAELVRLIDAPAAQGSVTP